MIPEDERGIWKPSGCPRGRDDCDPLSNIVSTCGDTFVCLGLNDGSTRVIEEDRYRHCFKNPAGDDMYDLNDADMRDLVGVLSMGYAVALKIDEEILDAAI